MAFEGRGTISYELLGRRLSVFLLIHAESIMHG